MPPEYPRPLDQQSQHELLGSDNTDTCASPPGDRSFSPALQRDHESPSTYRHLDSPTPDKSSAVSQPTTHHVRGKHMSQSGPSLHPLPITVTPDSASGTGTSMLADLSTQALSQEPQEPLSLDALPVPPMENPHDAAYQGQVVEELQFDHSEAVLIAEVRGDRVPSVHGCGLWAYSGHTSPTSEQLKQSVFRQHATRQSWLESARSRTAHYSQPGVIRPPLRWVLVETDKNQDIPEDALQTGTEADGQKLYSARAWWRGGLHLGKAGRHLQDGASISYGSVEHPVPTFEVLTGDSFYARWVQLDSVSNESLAPGRPGCVAETAESTPTHEPQGWLEGKTQSPEEKSINYLPGVLTPLEGGREANGAPLFIAQGEYEMGWHPGKAGLDEDHCCIGYGGGEVWVRTFRVLAYDLDE